VSSHNALLYFTFSDYKITYQFPRPILIKKVRRQKKKKERKKKQDFVSKRQTKTFQKPKNKMLLYTDTKLTGLRKRINWNSSLPLRTSHGSLGTSKPMKRYTLDQG
jgi:hypothetical protein